MSQKQLTNLSDRLRCEMAGLRVSVHTAPPVPCVDRLTDCQMPHGLPKRVPDIFLKEAVLVDTAITIQ